MTRQQGFALSMAVEDPYSFRADRDFGTRNLLIIHHGTRNACCASAVEGLVPVFSTGNSLSEAIMDKMKTLLFAGLAAAAMLAGQACATPYFGAPPPPGWILNLDGQRNYSAVGPIRYVQHTVIFFAAQTTTHITFALTDSTFDDFFLDSITVTDLQSPGVNLIQNGGFEDGTAKSGGNASAPVDWRYLNPYVTLSDSGVICAGGAGYGQDGSSCAWNPGFQQTYDFITQPIATAIGDWYQVSFWAEGPDEGHDWTALNGNCFCNGDEGDSFNIVVYAGSMPRGVVPEPAALGMFGFGVLLIGGFFALRRREQSRA